MTVIGFLNFVPLRFSLPSQSEPAAGHTVSGRELQSYLSSAFRSAPHNVLLFFQDKVSSVLISHSRVQLMRCDERKSSSSCLWGFYVFVFGCEEQASTFHTISLPELWGDSQNSRWCLLRSSILCTSAHDPEIDGSPLISWNALRGIEEWVERRVLNLRSKERIIFTTVGGA